MSETASTRATPGPQSYPSPYQSGALPFYQQPGDEHRRSETPRREQHGQHEHYGGAHQGRNSADGEERREVPDDPQLRGRLERVLGGGAGSGSFSNIGALLAATQQDQHQSPPSTAPPAGPLFAHSNGSPETNLPQQSREKAPRTKVSRACDECRRKKIRCDAADETASTPCSSCARTGLRCAFSRQPMKRGPSKGYIKELAERLHTLEQQVQEPGVAPQHQAEIQQVQRQIAENMQMQGYTQQGQAVQGAPQSQTGLIPLEPRIGDKRSHAASEGMYNGQTNNAWNQPQRPPPPTLQPQSQVSQRTPIQNHSQPYHPAYSQSQPPTPSHLSQMQPFWRHGPDENRQESTSLPYESDSGPTNAAITNFDWDESVISEYYRIIHQTFPLLPNNKNRLRQRLAECPTSLREAFLAALDCLMRTFPTTTLPQNPGYAQALKRAAELLAKYPFDNPASHTSGTNLVYLQTLLLMALESDNHGPATIRGQAGPSRAEWLGRAAGVAGQIQINTIRMTSQSVMEGDRDSEDRLARRVWWVLFILDRWHASSTADLLKLPENSVILLPEDQILLGESTYHLARLSFIIGHLASILTTTKTPSTDVMAPSNPASALLGLTLAGEIDRFRESVESVWGTLNLVHLSYHHCHLLIKRLNPTTEPTELIEHAVKVATVLNSRLTPVTPLNHHFAALAAMTLCELCDVPKTRPEALRGLDNMVECLGEGRGLAGRQESEGWDGAIRELVVKKKERMLAQGGASGANGLQGLADAAVGKSGLGEGFDPTMLTRYGYLTALGQGIFRSQ